MKVASTKIQRTNSMAGLNLTGPHLSPLVTPYSKHIITHISLISPRPSSHRVLPLRLPQPNPRSMTAPAGRTPARRASSASTMRRIKRVNATPPKKAAGAAVSEASLVWARRTLAMLPGGPRARPWKKTSVTQSFAVASSNVSFLLFDGRIYWIVGLTLPGGR